MNDEFLDRLDEAALERWRGLYDACAAHVLDDPARTAYVDWFVARAPDAALPVPAGAPPARWYRALAVAMLDALPRPPEFRVRRPQRPGRNDPCNCGSGEKFKQCCAEFVNDVRLSDYDALEHILDALRPDQYAALVSSQIDTHALADVVGYWLELGAHARVAALLAPWFAPDTGKFNHTSAPLLPCYIDALLATNRHEDVDALVTLALARGDRPLRGAATRVRAYARLDAGDIDGAWEDFAEVRRLTPSDPTNATLELSILIDSRRYADAQARARYWLPRLERNPDREADAPLEFVQRVIENPETALEAGPPDRLEYPELGVLEALLEEAPPVVSAAPARHPPGGELTLDRDATLRQIETRWADVFPVRKPAGRDLFVENDEAWDEPEAWVDFLRDEDAAWQSIEILDDLALAVGDLLGVGTSDPLFDALLRRGAALVSAQTVVDGRVAGTLVWDLRENRAALRLLTVRAVRVGNDPVAPFQAPEFFELCERLIALDPADHHGARGLLAQGYLLQGEPERALALGAPTPDTYAELNHVLALYSTGRVDDARTALASIGHRDLWLAVLRDDDPDPPTDDPEAEADDDARQRLEAWGYRRYMRAMWQKSGALAWVDRVDV